MPIRSYRDLDVYKRARKLLRPIHELAASLPPHERFDLTDQMRRASKSVSANIVEGYGHKDTPKQAKAYWRTALGSANEMVEHLEQAQELEYLKPEITQPLIEEYIVIAKQLNRLIQNWQKF
jgi:four helix bundle protein